jgi:hypothetical protein
MMSAARRGSDLRIQIARIDWAIVKTGRLTAAAAKGRRYTK